MCIFVADIYMYVYLCLCTRGTFCSTSARDVAVSTAREIFSMYANNSRSLFPIY